MDFKCQGGVDLSLSYPEKVLHKTLYQDFRRASLRSSSSSTFEIVKIPRHFARNSVVTLFEEDHEVLDEEDENELEVAESTSYPASEQKITNNKVEDISLYPLALLRATTPEFAPLEEEQNQPFSYLMSTTTLSPTIDEKKTEEPPLSPFKFPRAAPFNSQEQKQIRRLSSRLSQTATLSDPPEKRKFSIYAIEFAILVLATTTLGLAAASAAANGVVMPILSIMAAFLGLCLTWKRIATPLYSLFVSVLGLVGWCAQIGLLSHKNDHSKLANAELGFEIIMVLSYILYLSISIFLIIRSLRPENSKEEACEMAEGGMI